MKRCFFCEKEIPDDAIKCIHCGQAVSLGLSYQFRCPKCNGEAEHIIVKRGRGDKAYKDFHWFLVIGCLVPGLGWIMLLVFYLCLWRTGYKEYNYCNICKHRF